MFSHSFSSHPSDHAHLFQQVSRKQARRLIFLAYHRAGQPAPKWVNPISFNIEVPAPIWGDPPVLTIRFNSPEGTESITAHDQMGKWHRPRLEYHSDPRQFLREYALSDLIKD